jgi:hypothetical protein
MKHLSWAVRFVPLFSCFFPGIFFDYFLITWKHSGSPGVDWGPQVSKWRQKLLHILFYQFIPHRAWVPLRRRRRRLRPLRLKLPQNWRSSTPRPEICGSPERRCSRSTPARSTSSWDRWPQRHAHLDHLQGCQRVYFHTKIPNLGTFWRALEWKMLVYLLAIWNILTQFGIVYGHLVILWSFGTYKFPCFGLL